MVKQEQGSPSPGCRPGRARLGGGYGSTIPVLPGILGAPKAPWLLHNPFLESRCDSGELGRFLGIRVPGMCPHPVGWDGIPQGVCGQRPARERFPFPSLFHPHPVSPVPHQKHELEEEQSRGSEEGCWGGFSPLGRMDGPKYTVLGAQNKVPVAEGFPTASTSHALKSKG